jgi:uncharacterized protein (DUF433 family)
MALAMATAAHVVYSHIVKEPGYCGGKAAIDNTRIRVSAVVCLGQEGKTPEEIRAQYPHLTLGQVHAALAYYYDHTDEIDAELAAEDDSEERFERRKAEALAERARQ